MSNDKIRYMRFPNDVDAAVETERTRRIKERGESLTFTGAVLELIRERLKSLSRRKR